MRRGAARYGGMNKIYAQWMPCGGVDCLAFLVVHGGALTGEGSGEMAFVYMAGFVALLIAGPGRHSLDHLVLRAFRGGE